MLVGVVWTIMENSIIFFLLFLKPPSRFIDIHFGNTRKHPSESSPPEIPHRPLRREEPRGPVRSQRVNGPHGFPHLFPHPNKLEGKDNKLEDYCFSKVRKSDMLFCE